MANWKEQSLRLWQNIGKRERYIIIGAAVLLFAAILTWSYWWGGRPENVPLFTNMDAEDAGEVAAKLKELKIPYEIGENGTTILVSSKDVYRIRLDLAGQGLPKGKKGFEIFDQNKFGVTEFQNKVYLLQALQGELARTIEQMAEVERARVHIVLSEGSLYKKDEKPATASIMLKLRPKAELNKEQVKGIVNLVAHSIQDLKPENITVVDSFARVLNAPEEDEEKLAEQMKLNGKQNITQIELARKIQDSLQKGAQSMLEQVLGPGKAAVRVNVELDFDRRTIDRQVFQPVVDDKGIVRSTQELTESYTGNSTAPGPAPGGVPGVTSNIPGYVTGNNNNSQSNYDKKEFTRNYEINETKEKVVASPGSIKRLTVSVLVDAAFNKAQQDSIAKVVASAVGLNPARGDAIAVEAIAFSTDIADRQKQEELAMEEKQKQSLYLKLGIGASVLLAALLIVWMILRHRRREAEMQIAAMLPPEPEEIEIPPEPEETLPELSPEELERAQQREAIEKFAKTKPEEASQLLRAWLADE